MSKYIDIQSQDYPCLLKEIRDPPKRLYYKGNFCNDIFKNCVSVVGSRVISNKGRDFIRYLFSTLDKSITIVSGFMIGIDAEAHRQALTFGLKTIAVLPCGIDRIHPEKNTDLYNDILYKDGLILSEYDCYSKPEIWTYPRRNRIVAGISLITVVIEASLQSGSLITASNAKSYGREVLVPTSSYCDSEGTRFISNAYAKKIKSGLEINKLITLLNKCDTNSLLNNFPSKYQLTIFQ